MHETLKLCERWGYAMLCCARCACACVEVTSTPCLSSFRCPALSDGGAGIMHFMQHLEIVVKAHLQYMIHYPHGSCDMKQYNAARECGRVQWVYLRGPRTAAAAGRWVMALSARGPPLLLG